MKVYRTRRLNALGATRPDASGKIRLLVAGAPLLMLLAITPAMCQVLPHIAVGGQFTTDFLVLNTGSAAASVQIDFFDDNGKPMALNFPDLKATATALHSSSPIPAGGSVFVEAADPNGPTRGGSALITADAGIIVHALFRSKAADGNFYEAAIVPTSGNTRFIVPFDATTFQPTGAQIYTGIAVANLDSTKGTTLTCTAKDASGVSITNGGITASLQPQGHWAGYNFPALIGKRGILDCTAATKVGAIGLRFLGSNAFSSLPVVESSAPVSSATTPAWILGTWAATQGQMTLTFYADGRVVFLITYLGLTYAPKNGTFQVTPNSIVVNWAAWESDPPEEETINIVQSGSVTTLVQNKSGFPVVFKHQ